MVADQFCTPIYTADLATATAALLTTDRYGLYHLTSGGAYTWHDFAAAIFALAGVQADLSAITSQQFGAPARRPGYSVLDTGKYAALG